MFQVGLGELIVVIAVSVWVFGPRHLSLVAKIGARWISRGKHQLTRLYSEINEEINQADRSFNMTDTDSQSDPK